MTILRVANSVRGVLTAAVAALGLWATPVEANTWSTVPGEQFEALGLERGVPANVHYDALT